MNIMTLSMAERTNKNDYQIIGLNLDNQEIVSLVGISRENICSENKDNWDIGAITEVENLISTGANDMSYFVEGKVKLENEFNRELFLKILKMKSHGRSNFFLNEKDTYDIIRIHRLDDIYQKDGKHYIKAIIAAKSDNIYQAISDNGIKQQDGLYMHADLLVKDVRWVNYWNWAIKTGVYEEKRVIYRKQFNKMYHDKYIIIYRHRYPYNRSYYWVTGLHLL